MSRSLGSVLGRGVIALIALAIAISGMSFVGKVVLMHALNGVDPQVDGELRAALAEPGLTVVVRAVPRDAIVADTNSPLVMRQSDIDSAFAETGAWGAQVRVRLRAEALSRIRGALSIQRNGLATFVNAHRVAEFATPLFAGPSPVLVSRVSPSLAGAVARRINGQVRSRDSTQHR